jgi:TRAP-type transport system small permease protein
VSTQAHFRVADRVRGLGPAARLLTVVSSLLLFAMMGVVFVDVIGRYLFLAPLPAAYELVSLLMPGIIFCALPLTVLREGHVTVDLLDSLVPRAVARIQGVLVNLFSAAALGLVAWRLWVLSGDQAEFDTVTDALFLPLWPFSVGMSALCVLAAVAALVNAWMHLTGRKGR